MIGYVCDVAELTPELAGPWAALFEASSCPCYCRYWHFEGDKNAWLDRCANDRERNRRDHLTLVVAKDDRARGLVAMRGRECVGWLKLTPRACVSKLRNLAVYRSLDLGDDEGVWSIGCVLVRPDVRREGIAHALISSSVDYAKEWGGRAVEAYPHVQEGEAADEQMWRGVITSYEQAGFHIEAGELPYPVLRRDLHPVPVLRRDLLP